MAAGRQLGEHRGLDRRDAVEQLDGFRAQRLRRRVAVAVPLQIKTFPAALEEGVESGVVVRLRLFDVILQAHGFLADHLPVVGQRLQLREAFFVEIGLFGGQTGEAGHKHVDRPHKGGVIEQLAGKLLFLFAAGVCVEEADDKNADDDRGNHRIHPCWCLLKIRTNYSFVTGKI